jgi:hypothetical protein
MRNTLYTIHTISYNSANIRRGISSYWKLKTGIGVAVSPDNNGSFTMY